MQDVNYYCAVLGPRVAELAALSIYKECALYKQKLFNLVISLVSLAEEMSTIPTFISDSTNITVF